jgi:hypothetical protein
MGEDVRAELLEVALGVLRGWDAARVARGRLGRLAELAVHGERATRSAAEQLDREEQDDADHPGAAGQRHARAHAEPAAAHPAAAGVDHVRAAALSSSPAHVIPLPRRACVCSA